MRHYEIILLVKPDSNQVQDMIERYTQFILESTPNADQVDNPVEVEHIGRQPIYPMKKNKKAYFVRMNIQCLPATQEELMKKFSLNDEIIRYHNLKRPQGMKNPIILNQIKETEGQRQGPPPSSDTPAASVDTASGSK